MFGTGTSLGSAKFIPYLYSRIRTYIQNLTLNSVIIADRETVQISTDSDGNNEDFTNSTVNFLVYYGGSNQTPNWTISVDSTTNCTVNQVGNAISVTAITTDEASYLVRADRTDYTPITKVIQVSKVRDGADGADGQDGIGLATVDDETVEIDGGGDLKVKNHTYYDDGSDYTNCLVIGNGSLNNALSEESYDFINISYSGNSRDISGVDNVVSIGDSDIIRYTSTGAPTVTNGVVAGDLLVRPHAGGIMSNFIINGVQINPSFENRINSNTAAFGIDPSNKLSNSTSIGLYKNAAVFSSGDSNDVYFLSRSELVPSTTPTNIDLDLSTVDVSSDTIIKIKLDITGQIPGSGFYTEDVYLVIENSTAVVDYSDTNKQYDSGTLNGITVTHSYTSNTVRVGVPSLGSGSNWVINYEIKAIF